MPKTIHAITVQLVENDYGDQDIKVDPGGARLHELVGLLEVGKAYLIDQHTPPGD